MFEFLFKYPPAIFSKGKFVLLSPWPVWLLLLLLVAAAARSCSGICGSGTGC